MQEIKSIEVDVAKMQVNILYTNGDQEKNSYCVGFFRDHILKGFTEVINHQVIDLTLPVWCIICKDKYATDDSSFCQDCQ